MWRYNNIEKDVSEELDEVHILNESRSMADF